MEDTLTIRLTSELSAWLRSTAKITGIPVSRLVREHLERAKKESGEKPFMRYTGIMSGPPDLSSRKGFSRK